MSHSPSCTDTLAAFTAADVWQIRGQNIQQRDERWNFALLQLAAHQTIFSVTTSDFQDYSSLYLPTLIFLPPPQKIRIIILFCRTAAEVRNPVCLPTEATSEGTGRGFLQDPRLTGRLYFPANAVTREETRRARTAPTDPWIGGKCGRMFWLLPFRAVAAERWDPLLAEIALPRERRRGRRTAPRRTPRPGTGAAARSWHTGPRAGVAAGPLTALPARGAPARGRALCAG